MIMCEHVRVCVVYAFMYVCMHAGMFVCLLACLFVCVSSDCGN